MKSVVIADYGVGNLRSVARAVEFSGATAIVSSNPKTIESAERFILPGVGAFGDGMLGIKTSGLIESIYEFARTERPFLGICLGMQMLVDTSNEFGKQVGLGLIAGDCVPIPATDVDGIAHKVPHIGWNELILPHDHSTWRNSIFKDVVPGEEVYFVHSWMVQPKHDETILALTEYGGRMVTAAIRQDQFTGCQFHPEKSGPAGIKILKTFIEN
jgi:glutamine amidotransferase